MRLHNIILTALLAAIIVAAAVIFSCSKTQDEETTTSVPLMRAIAPASGDTLVQVVLGVMEGYYAMTVADSIIGLTPSVDDGAFLMSTRMRGNTRVERIGELQTFVIKVPEAFAGQNLVVQISNTGPCDSEPWISEGVLIPFDGLVYIDVSPERVPFMSFYVTGFLPPIHGQYWRLERSLD